MRSDEQQVKTLQFLLERRKNKLAKEQGWRMQGERRNGHKIRELKEQVQALEWALAKVEV